MTASDRPPQPPAVLHRPTAVLRATLGLAILSTCAIAPLARAEVYKCAGDGGRPIYQEMPCPKGKELRNFQNDPPEITVLPGTAKTDSAAVPGANARPGKDSAAEKTALPRTEKPRGDPAERRHLHSGMSEGDVLARVGTPDATTSQRNGKQMRWTWLPAKGDPETVTTVTFLNGVVATVERTLVKK